MRGVCRKQTPEKLKLSQRLASNLATIVKVDGAIQLPPPAPVENPFAEIQMKSDSESGMGSGVTGRLGRCGPAHQQTGARHDPSFEGLDDAARHARGLPEVVCID